jgi:hypothetical protein
LGGFVRAHTQVRPTGRPSGLPATAPQNNCQIFMLSK